MPIAADADDLEFGRAPCTVDDAATAACPFHPEVTIRIGDIAAETHAFYRARNLVKMQRRRSWNHDLLMEEIARQLCRRGRPRVPPMFGRASCLI